MKGDQLNFKEWSMNLIWQNRHLTRIYNPEFNFYKQNSSKLTNSEGNFHYQAKRNPLLLNPANNKSKTMNHKLQNWPTKLGFKKVRFKDLIKPWEKSNFYFNWRQSDST